MAETRAGRAGHTRASVSRRPIAIGLALALACALTLCGGAACARVATDARAGLRIAWQRMPPLPRPLAGQAAGLSHGALLVAGGTDFPTPLFEGGTKVWFDAVHVLEPGGTQWRTPLRLASPIAYAAAGTIDDRLIVAGGSNATGHAAHVFSLEWRDGQVQQRDLPSLPHPIAMAGAAVLGRTLFVVGGQRGPSDRDALGEVWALDLPATFATSAPLAATSAAAPVAWRSLPPLPGPGRILPVVAARGGRLIVASGAAIEPTADGKTMRRRYLTDAYAWRADTGWRRIADVPHPIVAAPAVPLGPSHVAVFGGDDGVHAARVMELKDAHPGFSRDAIAYDTVTDTWSRLGALPAAVVTTQAVIVGDAVVLPGGEDRPGHRSATVLRGRIDTGVQQVDVFVSGRDGYHTYRIPSLIVTANSTLLAFAEARRSGGGDAGDIDLVVKRSEDDGATWSAMKVIGDNGPHTFGNPCPAIDRRTGTIWLLTTQNRGTDREKDILAGTSEASRTVWVMHSADGGVTWSVPVEITSSVKQPDWTWYATGPGVGIQTKPGRLVIPANHAEAGTGIHRSHIIYSDDGGKTWQLGGSSDPGTNESQVVELTDGRLMLNMRNHPAKPDPNHRMVATSADGGRTFAPAVADRALIEPPAQASLLRGPGYGPRRGSGRGRVLLFANPASTERERMTVRVSDDDGSTWRHARVLHDGPAAYSSLAVLPDRRGDARGRIGVLFERGDASPYERVTFARVTLDWLTSAPRTGIDASR